MRTDAGRDADRHRGAAVIAEADAVGLTAAQRVGADACVR